jgi:transcription antitermination factor NusG
LKNDQDPGIRWYAVQTRPRSEKFVQRMLAKKGVHAWVPIQKFLRRYTRSTKWVEKPLINCYVFVHMPLDQYVTVLETENVYHFVRVAKEMAPIPDAEIEILRRITLETELEIEARPGQMEAGDPVEISAGSLAGLKGRVLKVDGKRKMQVELSHLGYSLLITIDASFLEKTGALS